MKKMFLVMMCLGMALTWTVNRADALGESDRTVVYKIVHHSASGELTSYVAYSIAADEPTAYWLQRTTHLKLDSAPLSITQTLLDKATLQPIRYLMYRPANMDKPPRVVDLPLSDMGKDEVLPTSITGMFVDAGQLHVEAGTFAVKQGQTNKLRLWLGADAPVLGVVKAQAQDWTMELVRIDQHAEDLFPQKPPKGGTVNLKEFRSSGEF